MSRKTTLIALLGATLIAGCTVEKEPAADETSATPAPEATVASAGGVTRDVVEPAEPAVQALPEATVIQSQPGPEGSQLDLLKVAVTGDILTVTLRCSSSERVNSESFKVSDISVIDDATSQRISVLKDNDGNWMASNVSGDRIGTSCETKPGIIWAKFPAPPATSQTISLNLPQVAPFDGVPVTR